MEDYFSISLIGKRTSTSKAEVDACLKRFGLIEGKYKTDLFEGKQVIASYYDYDEEGSDFDELCVSIHSLFLTKDTLDRELVPITNFVNGFFLCNPNLIYALCSYELNGYLIGQCKGILDFDNPKFLNRFPLVYKRSETTGSHMELNLGAQDIFIDPAGTPSSPAR